MLNQTQAMMIVDSIENTDRSACLYLPDLLHQRFSRIVTSLPRVKDGSEQFEKRRFPRKSVFMPLMAIQLDDSLKVIGYPFEILVLDVSVGGMGLVHTRCWNKVRLAVRLERPAGGEHNVYAIVLCKRSKPFYGYYTTGVSFEMVFHTNRIDELPVAPTLAKEEAVELSPLELLKVQAPKPPWAKEKPVRQNRG
jgi:hypothetical protein